MDNKEIIKISYIMKYNVNRMLIECERNEQGIKR
jgi:hypothetical protein